MADENDKLISELLGMLGDNPEEKISKVLGDLTSSPQGALAAPNDTQDALGGIDMSTILSLQKAFSGGNDDDNTRLLSAIKPFLNDRRKPQVDHILKLLKLANIAQKAGGMDILKNLKL